MPFVIRFMRVSMKKLLLQEIDMQTYSTDRGSGQLLITCALSNGGQMNLGTC